MDVPDFRRCPTCGEEDFDLKSEEKLCASNRPTLTLGEDGELLAAEWGLTEPDYNTSTTTEYYGGCCGEALPEEHQDALDEALHNERRPEEPAGEPAPRPLVFVYLDDEDEERHGTFVLELTRAVDDPATVFFAAIQAFANHGAPESTCFLDGATEAMLFELALWIRDQDLAPFGLRWVRPAHAYELDGAFVVRRTHQE